MAESREKSGFNKCWTNLLQMCVQDRPDSDKDTAKLAYLAGRRDALEEQWISVTEGLPDMGEDVHVWVIHEGMEGRVTDSWLAHDLSGSGVNWAMGSAENYKVTHWRKLPEPPKAAAIRALLEKEKP